MAWSHWWCDSICNSIHTMVDMSHAIPSQQVACPKNHGWTADTMVVRHPSHRGCPKLLVYKEKRRRFEIRKIDFNCYGEVNTIADCAVFSLWIGYLIRFERSVETLWFVRSNQLKILWTRKPQNFPQEY